MKEPWEVYGIINGMEGFQLSVVGGRLRPLLLVLAHGLQRHKQGHLLAMPPGGQRLGVVYCGEEMSEQP